MGSNAPKSLRQQAFGERSEDFSGALPRESNGIEKAVEKVQRTFPTA